MREILVPHDMSRGPLTAVRRMLVQSSFAELKQRGLYERYCAVIKPEVLAEITDLIGPGWLPVSLALSHYQTLDKLGLSDSDIHEIGMHSGDKMQDALLVASKAANSDSDPSPWPMIGAFSRMGRRLFEGSSSQYVKLGAKQLLIEVLGHPLFAGHYYRVAHTGFLRTSFGSLGVDVIDVTAAGYRSEGARIDVRLSWR